MDVSIKMCDILSTKLIRCYKKYDIRSIIKIIIQWSNHVSTATLLYIIIIIKKKKKKPT